MVCAATGAFTWSTWTSVTGQPAPREGAALCAGHSHLLFLHGGASNFGMSDLWVYDQKHSAWTEIAATGRRPPMRRGHLLFVYNSFLYCFGGFDELGSQSTSMWRLPVPYGTNWAAAKLAWVEVEADRVFNRNRCTSSHLKAFNVNFSIEPPASCV